MAEYPDTGDLVVVPAPGESRAIPGTAGLPLADAVTRAMEAGAAYDATAETGS